jgi:hypothetical protein
MNNLKTREQELIKELSDVQKQIRLGKDVKQKIYRIEDVFSNNGLRIRIGENEIEILADEYQNYYMTHRCCKLNNIIQFMDKYRNTIDCVLGYMKGDLLYPEGFYIDEDEFRISCIIERREFRGQYTTKVTSTGEVTIAAYLKRSLAKDTHKTLPNGVEYHHHIDTDESFEEYSYEVVVAEAGEGEDMTLYDYIIALDEVTDKLYVTVDIGVKC